MLLNEFSTAFTCSNFIVYQLFYFWKITSELNLWIHVWMVFICNMKSSGKCNMKRWEKREFTLYIVDGNHQRSVILVDILGILKAFGWWWLQWGDIYPGRGN